MKKSGLLLCAAAGSMLSVTAMAQVADTNVPHPIPASLDRIQGGDYLRGGHYGSRVDLDVYGIGWQDQTGGTAAGPAVAPTVYDDVTFGGGCSQTLPISINGMAWGFWEPATASPADDHVYMKVSFYPDHNNAAPATSAPFSGTPVVANLDLGTGWSGCPGCGEFFHDSVAFTAAWASLDATNVFNAGASDRTAGVLQELYADAALTVRRDNYGVMRRANQTAFLVGTSDTFSWFDSSSPNTGTITNDSTHFSGGGALGTNSRGTFLNLQATGCSVPPPTATALGCIPDSPVTSVTGTLTASTVNWYTFCISSGATDDLLHFIDIDSEGSSTDVAIAVYTNAGVLGANSADHDSGSGVNAQLSFGIGRRAAVGDGMQYDGRNFNGGAGLPAGTYYLAVAGNGASFGPTGWSVNADATAGTYHLNLRTNVNGGALAPSVAPIPLAGDDFSASPLTAPGAQIVGAALDPYVVRWLKFATCINSDNTNTVVIDMNGTDAVNTGLELFDSSGNLVSQASNANGLSTMTFDGTNVLPAGTYYLAMNYNGVNLAPSPSTAGRWHVRSTNGSNGFNFAGEILVQNSSCGSNFCCLADYNGDGDVGTDADIEAFFQCLAGNCCATCPPDADFNCDGDIGTDADIESFFRVLAGGAC